MRRTLALVLLALGASACSWPASGEPHPVRQLREVTGQWITPSGNLCSATAVGPHAIATTKHCINEGERQVRFQGILWTITRVMSDGAEGVLVIINGDLTDYAVAGPPPELGSALWLVGNPNGMKQMVRRGLASGYMEAPQGTVLMVDCRCYKGDSGAGIFDAQGRLVAIMYGMVVTKDGLLVYPYAFPLTFTADQWRVALRP